MNSFKDISKGLVLSIVAASSLYASPSKTELDSMKKIVGYFPEWGIYSGHNNYVPANVPFDKITHLNYAFATIKDGLIAHFDTYAATEVTHGEAWDSPYKGNLGQFEKLKQDHPHLSVMVSVGGWLQSGNFHDVAATQEARDKFAASVVQYIREHKMDGVDIDWEYPGSYREPDLQDNPNDQGTPKADDSEKETFRLLLQTLRTHLDTAGSQDGKYYQLTAALSASFTNIDFIEPQTFAQYLDFMNIMTYDLHGAWDTQTNHQSALYSKEALQDNLNISDVVDKFVSMGIDKRKLIIGTPFYSRGWKGVIQNNPEDGLVGLLAEASGGADGIWNGGVPGGMNPYYHLVEMENDPAYTKYYDTEAQAPYLYSATKGEFFTYEDRRSLGAKVEYVNTNQLGGIIIWELSGDLPVTNSGNLLTVISDGFYPNGINVNAEDVTEEDVVEENNNSVVSEENITEENGDAGTSQENEVIPDTEAWQSTKVYNVPDEVSYNGVLYRAKWWTQGDEPGTQEYGPWEVLGESEVNTNTDTTVDEEQTTTEENNSEVDDEDTSESTDTELTTSNDTWSATTVYTGGEVVVYKNIKYEAQWWTQGDIPGTQEWGPWRVVEDSTPVTPPAEEEQPTDESTNTDTTTSDDTVGEDPSVVSLEKLQQDEASLTDTPLMGLVKESIRTLPNEQVELISALNSSNPENVKRVESVLSSTQWDYLFPQRSPEYTYENFLKAVGKFPAFCGDYSDGKDAELICRKSLATMFAHFTQETGGHTAGLEVPQWRQGLVHIREMGWDESMRGGYNAECNTDIWQGQRYPCGTFENGEYKSYFGRGAKQLSYNYNYGPFSEAMTGDVTTLLNNPELVADTWYNLASAVFFFVYPQPPKPSMLHTIDGTWVPNVNDVTNGLTPGFGVTTQIINGGVECGGSVEIAQSLNRIEYYTEFSNYLGVDIPEDEVLGCANMKQFSSDGAGALPIYWEEDWSWSSETPDGRSYQCQLVNYQTAYSAFIEGDYVKCVEDTFNVTAQ